jgi:hypothetical protein
VYQTLDPKKQDCLSSELSLCSLVIAFDTAYKLPFSSSITRLVMDSRQISTSLCNAIQTISLQLCTMIRSGRLVACEAVKEYLLHTTKQHIIRDITGALSANVATLIENYLNLTDLEYVEPIRVVDLS